MTRTPIDPLKTRLIRNVPHASPLIGCRFDPSGRFLFTASQDSTLQRIDLVTSLKTALTAHAGWVRGLAFVAASPPLTPVRPWASPALLGSLALGRESEKPVAPFFVVSGDYHGKLIWWEGHVPSPTPVRTIDAHDGWIRAVAMSPNGSLLATCGNDRLVKIWSSADGRPLHTFTGHESHVYNVVFHPDRKSLVSADHHGIVKHWDLVSLKLFRDLDAKVLYKYDTGFEAHIGGIRGIHFDDAGTTLACCGITNVSNAFAGVGNPGVVIFDWVSGKPRSFAPKEAYQGTCWGVHVHAAGYVIAAGGAADGRLWFWKSSDGSPVHVVATPLNARDLTVHPDGSALAIAGHNGSALIYSMAAD